MTRKLWAKCGIASAAAAEKGKTHTDTQIRDSVSLGDLKRYAAEPEAANASTVPQSRKGNHGPGGVPTKERTELAGAGEMTGSRQRGNY